MRERDKRKRSQLEVWHITGPLTIKFNLQICYQMLNLGIGFMLFVKGRILNRRCEWDWVAVGGEVFYSVLVIVSTYPLKVLVCGNRWVICCARIGFCHRLRNVFANYLPSCHFLSLVFRGLDLFGVLMIWLVIFIFFIYNNGGSCPNQFRYLYIFYCLVLFFICKICFFTVVCVIFVLWISCYRLTEYFCQMLKICQKLMCARYSMCLFGYFPFVKFGTHFFLCIIWIYW